MCPVWYDFLRHSLILVLILSGCLLLEVSYLCSFAIFCHLFYVVAQFSWAVCHVATFRRLSGLYLQEQITEQNIVLSTENMLRRQRGNIVLLMSEWYNCTIGVLLSCQLPQVRVHVALSVFHK